MALKLTIYFLLFTYSGSALKLEQAIILSRPNLRSPLTENLEQFGPDVSSVSNYTAGQLTPKGALLEKYMGEYIGNWLRENELLPKICPEESAVFVYANTAQRTKESAQAFVDGAFPGCNVTVHTLDSNETDPIFHPIIRSNSSVLKDLIVHEMKNNLKKVNVGDSYLELDKLVNLTNSYMCREKNLCTFYNFSDEIFYQAGEEPDVIGPLKYGNSIVDAFLMAYYEGNPIENITGGHLKLEKLQYLSKITDAYQNVRYRSIVLAKAISRQLIIYIYDLLYTSDIQYLHIVGHDFNLQSVMTALNLKEYILPEQTEYTPIGGKVIFQKWRDEATNDTTLKIHYVYQTTEQLRNGVQLSKENPPHWVDMEMFTCRKNKNGLSPWTCLEYKFQDLKYVKIIPNLRKYVPK